MIADLCPGAELFAGCHAGNGEEVYIAHFYNIAEEGRLVGEHDLIRPGTDFFYINGMAEGDAQAFSLADCVMGDAFVCPEDVSVLIHKVAGPRDLHNCFPGKVIFLFREFLDEIGVVAVCHETDFLGIGLVCHGQAGLLRDLSDLVFAVGAQGHESGCKLFLAELVEHIGLVLGGEIRPLDGVSAVFQPNDVGIVACSDIIRLHDFGSVEHFVPLQITIALNTGIGSLSVEIALYKRLHDRLGKIADTVERIKTDAQSIGYPARIIDLAAPAFSPVACIPGAQCHTAHFIAFFLQKICRHGAVHTAGHTD